MKITHYLNPSGANILRVEMALLDCPGEITDLYTYKHGHREKLFVDRDVTNIRAALCRGSLKDDEGSFLEEYKRFNSIRDISFLVRDYGRFIMFKDVERAYSLVMQFNDDLSNLKFIVRNVLSKFYTGFEGLKKVERFNPRMKINTYILPISFVQDDTFRWKLRNACEKYKLGATVNELLGITEDK